MDYNEASFEKNFRDGISQEIEKVLTSVPAEAGYETFEDLMKISLVQRERHVKTALIKLNEAKNLMKQLIEFKELESFQVFIDENSDNMSEYFITQIEDLESIEDRLEYTLEEINGINKKTIELKRSLDLTVQYKDNIKGLITSDIVIMGLYSTQKKVQKRFNLSEEQEENTKNFPTEKAAFTAAAESSIATATDEQASTEEVKATYAETTKVDSKTEEVTRWGDYESSDEEVDFFSKTINKLGGAGVQSTEIEIPSDFELVLPHIYSMWKKRATKWNWTLKVTDVSLVREGFIFPGGDENRVEAMLQALSEDKKRNLTAFICLLCSVAIAPETLERKDQGQHVASFVTSLFLINSCKNNDDKLKLAKLALKNSDGGRFSLLEKAYSCFLTGTGCATMLFNSVEKMLKKIASTASDKDKAAVLSRCSSLCFTTKKGMLTNCYRLVEKRGTEKVETKNKKGKTVTSIRSVTRKGRDKPCLKSSDMITSNIERIKLRRCEASFNIIDAVADEVFDKIKNSKDILKDAKASRLIADLAYAKMADIRKIEKSRRNAVRSRAKELAEGKKIDTNYWLAATRELLPNFEEIDDVILEQLKWDIPEIISDLKLDELNTQL